MKGAIYVDECVLVQRLSVDLSYLTRITSKQDVDRISSKIFNQRRETKRHQGNLVGIFLLTKLIEREIYDRTGHQRIPISDE